MYTCQPTVWSVARQSYWQSQAGIRGQERPQACKSGSQDKGQSCPDSEQAAKMDQKS
jgi:hypothetical protein